MMIGDFLKKIETQKVIKAYEGDVDVEEFYSLKLPNGITFYSIEGDYNIYGTLKDVSGVINNYDDYDNLDDWFIRIHLNKRIDDVFEFAYQMTMHYVKI